jgi:hypothetical protein
MSLWIMNPKWEEKETDAGKTIFRKVQASGYLILEDKNENKN